MHKEPENQPSSPNPDETLRIDFAVIEFPSDALSVKRLRTIFPEKFENGLLTDGFGSFFSPIDDRTPSHLVRLNDLLSAERTLADYAFYDAIDPYPSETLDEECRWCADEARKELEQLYQEFKLADSPETARLLIQHVEESGKGQGIETKGRGR
jgi:hypothetical protein